MNTREKAGKSRQLNLKDPEIYELAAQLAQLHSETLSGAVKSALREKLGRDTHTLSKEERLARLDALIGSYAARIGPRTMTDEDAIGYDEFGLPT